MKIIISHDNGTVVEIIEGVEDYDLSKKLARVELMEEIIDAIDRARPSANPRTGQ